MCARGGARVRGCEGAWVRGCVNRSVIIGTHGGTNGVIDATLENRGSQQLKSQIYIDSSKNVSSLDRIPVPLRQSGFH